VRAGAVRALLADVLAVLPPDQAKVWNETIVARLGELRPDVYAGWEPEQLTAALKPFGITTTQVWGTDPASGKGANRRGITRQAVADAAANQPRRPPGEAA